MKTLRLIKELSFLSGDSKWDPRLIIDKLPLLMEHVKWSHQFLYFLNVSFEKTLTGTLFDRYIMFLLYFSK